MKDFYKKEKPLSSLVAMGGGSFGLFNKSAGGLYPPDTYWISEAARGSWDNEYVEDLVGDNQGDIYVVSIRYSGGGTGYKTPSIVKHAVDGTVTWQKVITKNASPYPVEVRAIGAEFDGDHIYHAGQSDDGMYIAKMNKSDGTVDWTRKIDGQNSNNMPIGIAVASNGNPIMMARMNSDNDKQLYSNHNTSDGSFSSRVMVQRTNGGSSTFLSQCTAKLDASGNLHSTVWGRQTHPQYYNGVVKHNSSLVLQSISDYQTSSPAEDLFGDIAVDSSGNKYVSFRYNTGSGNNYVGLMKLNSSDVIQWQKAAQGANYITCDEVEVTPDESGVIVCFEDRQNQGGSGNQMKTFVKFDLSGNVIWKRQFGITGVNLNGTAPMRLNRNGNIIFNSYFTANSQTYTITAQLPGDGSLTGTYTLGSRTYEWEANSLSFSTVSAWTKQASSVFASTTNSSANAAYPAQTLINNVQTFTKVTVS